MLLLACCGRDIPRAEAPLPQQLSDSIQAGRYEQVIRLVDEKLPSTTDSDTYHTLKVFKGIAEYYLARPDSLRLHLASPIAYAASHPSNASRAWIGAKAQMTLGAACMQYDYNPDCAEKCYMKALDYINLYDNPTDRLQLYGNLGDVYKLSGRLDLSLDYYQRAIELADSLRLSGDKTIQLTLGLASAFTDLRDFDSSRPLFERAENSWKSLPASEKFNYLSALTNSFYYQKDYNAARATLLRLDSLVKKNPDMVWEKNFGDVNMADVYIRLGRPDSADMLLDSATVYFTETQPNPYVLDYISTLRMKQNLLEGNLAEVEAQLAARDHTEEERRPEQRLADLEFRKEYYARRGDWKNAYEAERNYNALDDSLRSQRILTLNTAMRRRYERDMEVASLKNELRDHKRKITANYVMVGGSAVVIALLVVLALMTRRLSRLREERMMRKLLELRMKNMRGRITPHFIFNALNHEMAMTDDHSSRMQRIVRLLRRQQLMADELVCSLADELDFIEDYVAIESDGIPGPLDFKMEIAPALDPMAVKLPSMTLQIFVENAFKHGFSTLPPGTPRILRITVTREKDNVVVTVFNNMEPGAFPSADSTRTGLKVVAATLQMLNEHQTNHLKFSLSPWTDNPQHSGCAASLIIPRTYNFVSFLQDA